MGTAAAGEAGQFKTVVALDLETTGLDRPRVTELCMVAADTASLAGCRHRVRDVVTMCFNPLKPIHPAASAITGLHNDQLQDRPGLDATAVFALDAFLRRQPGPVVVVAHNGHKFDFPVLSNEMQRLEVTPDTCLFLYNEHVILADSLVFAYTQDDVDRQNAALEDSPSEKLRKFTLDSPLKAAPDKCDECITTGCPQEPPPPPSSNCLCNDSLLDAAPPDPPSTPPPPSTRKSVLLPPRPRGYFKLESIYERTFDKPIPDSHTAFGDCDALLRIISHQFTQFSAWVQRSITTEPHVKFECVENKYPPSPKKKPAAVSLLHSSN